MRAKLCERWVGRDGEWALSPFSVGTPPPPQHPAPRNGDQLPQEPALQGFRRQQAGGTASAPAPTPGPQIGTRVWGTRVGLHRG